MKEATLPPSVFRLGRQPDPWAWPDWATAGSDGTFANRFDDPGGTYRVLYSSTQRLATFVECLACFRPDPELLAELAAIAGEARDGDPPPAGTVPREWLDARCMGSGNLVGSYVDIGHHDTLAELRTALVARVVHHGVSDLDAAAIRLSAPRSFTQEISRYVFERSHAGERRWNGITYRSKYGDDLENWAIFEPAHPDELQVTRFRGDDSDLVAALRLHRLILA